jgi:serine/threonine protein kinase
MNEVGVSESGLMISNFRDSIDVLLRARLLDPPSHPGLLACLDRYEILQVVGFGGMGIVLLGRDKPAGPAGPEAPTLPPAPKDASAGALGESPAANGLAQPPSAPEEIRPSLVAIKLLRPELLGNVREVHRFLTEAQHMQRLIHPNIVPVLEISNQIPSTPRGLPAEAREKKPAACPVLKPKRPYFVMPYLERGSLAKLIHSAEPIDEGRILRLAQQIAAALGHVHEKGIVHRDLKPGNILITSDGRAQLTDFGLCRTVWNDSTVDVRLSQPVGTSCYMSPAVAAGEAEDTRCDIYAFGAVLYEMLARRAPYQGTNPSEVLNCIMAGPPTPILTVNPQASRGLARIAEGAMSRTLSNRYARMADVLADLERAEKGQPPRGPRSEAHGLEAKPFLLGRSGYRAAFAAVLVLALLGFGWWAGSCFLTKAVLETSLKIELPGVFQWGNAQVGDWDGDGRQELFLVDNDQLLVVADQGPLIRQARLSDPGSRGMALDMVAAIDGDRFDKVFLHWNSGTNLSIVVLNQHLDRIKQFHAQGAVGRHPDDREECSTLVARRVIDLEHNGTRKLLAAVQTDLALKPRGLYCYDFNTQALDWSFSTAPNVGALDFLDLNGEGCSDILVGSVATANGNMADDGTDDAHSYLYALSHRGRLLWSQELGGKFTQATPLVADLEGDGQKEILVWVTTTAGPPLPGAAQASGRILRLDSQGRTVKEFRFESRIMSCVTAFLSRDRKLRIVATDQRGFVYILNGKLELELKRQVSPPKLGTVELRIAAIDDLDGDGLPELVLTSSQCQAAAGATAGFDLSPRSMPLRQDNRVLILTPGLSIKTSYLVAKKWKSDQGFSVRLVDWECDGQPKVVVCAQHALVLQLAKEFRPFSFFVSKE